MKVKDLLKHCTKYFHFISEEKSVREGVNMMSRYGVSALYVMTNESAKGIFTERDLLKCHILFPDTKIDEILIQDVITTELIVAEPEDTIEDAMRMMIKAKIRHLPVISEGNIISMLCLEDLVREHVGTLTQELHYLKDYISDIKDALS